MGAELRAIVIALEWAHRNGIDLEERIGNLSLLLPHEVLSLRDALRLKQGGPVRRGTSKIVTALTHYSRCHYVRNFFVWRAQHVAQAIPNDDGRFLPARTRIEEFGKGMVALLSKIRGKGREGISHEVDSRLREVIASGHAENPFQAGHQHRNHALLLMYLDLGIRLSEALVIKGADLQLQDEKPTVTIHRRADDIADTRRNQPLTKTASRLLPLGDALRLAISDWVLTHQADKNRYPGAKKTPYLFVARNGQPIAKQTVADMLRLLRGVEGLPSNLSAHILRHTWNDRFSELSDELGTPENDEIQERNYLMGWKKTSSQGADYTHRHTRRRAAKASLALQGKSTHGDDL